ncbi:hypothetical protein PC9H_004333 [Pleurotus ostreatus]|uniref:Uncharacterized protein n=1 Tax=Pleurotus ostreatus TaxID=5322 RepID=A0A8H7A3M2_PLEOS|nr:uncharacterized protein PC9H_004333 [Pleurotus ostreatus]KAF7437492.1 hypothetical protein PC9H_004333 [Pleurotus ostreatus]
MANIALGFAPLTPNSILHLPLTNENVPQVMQLLASLREQYDQQPNSITWTTPGSDNVRYLVPTNIPDLATNKVEVDEAPTNFACANCGTQNFVKEKKQYYAVTSGAQVGVVKGANTATALIHGVSGGVCLGFRSEALAVEHFQKGVNGGTVVVCKPVGSPM